MTKGNLFVSVWSHKSHGELKSGRLRLLGLLVFIRHQECLCLCILLDRGQKHPDIGSGQGREVADQGTGTRTAGLWGKKKKLFLLQDAAETQMWTQLGKRALAKTREERKAAVW